MLQLHKNEKVLAVLHKHWFDLARPAVAFFILLVVPPLILSLLPLIPEFDTQALAPLINFFLAIYIAVLIGFIFFVWVDYYLDMWIITNKRIVDVEQYGLFSRQVSEIPLGSVQDITIDVHGLIETFLKFGTLRIQTAGEREFVIHNIPRLYETKDIILRGAEELRK